MQYLLNIITYINGKWNHYASSNDPLLLTQWLIECQSIIESSVMTFISVIFRLHQSFSFTKPLLRKFIRSNQLTLNTPSHLKRFFHSFAQAPSAVTVNTTPLFVKSIALLHTAKRNSLILSTPKDRSLKFTPTLLPMKFRCCALNVMVYWVWFGSTTCFLIKF